MSYHRWVVRVQLVRNSQQPGKALRKPEDVFRLLSDLQSADRERFIGIYLDSRNKINAIEEIGVGAVNASLVSPGQVFKTALLANAVSVIVAHNHPSGDPEPSQDDLRLTKRLARQLKFWGLVLLTT